MVARPAIMKFTNKMTKKRRDELKKLQKKKRVEVVKKNKATGKVLLGCIILGADDLGLAEVFKIFTSPISRDFDTLPDRCYGRSPAGEVFNKSYVIRSKKQQKNHAQIPSHGIKCNFLSKNGVMTHKHESHVIVSRVFFLSQDLVIMRMH